MPRHPGLIYSNETNKPGTAFRQVMTSVTVILILDLLTWLFYSSNIDTGNSTMGGLIVRVKTRLVISWDSGPTRKKD